MCVKIGELLPSMNGQKCALKFLSILRNGLVVTGMDYIVLFTIIPFFFLKGLYIFTHARPPLPVEYSSLPCCQAWFCDSLGMTFLTHMIIFGINATVTLISPSTLGDCSGKATNEQNGI